MKSFAFLIVAALVLQLNAAAQTTTAPDVKDDALTPALKKNGVELLTALAREAQQLNLPENRVRAQVQVAGLLWTHDEPAARAIFDNAFAELQFLLVNVNLPEGLELKTNDRARHYAMRHRLAELRREYVLTLAALDSKAALAALDGLRIKLLDEYDPLRPNELELQITAAIVRENPDRSYTVAKQQLDANGINYQFVEALKNLHKKDSRLAANLGRDILAKIKSSKIRAPSAAGNNTVKAKGEIDFWEVSHFINSAAQMNRQAARDKSKKTVPLLAEAEMKELVELAAGVYLNEPNPAQYSISQILPEITRLAPSFAQRIRQRLGAEASKQLERIVESNSFFTETQDKSADELAKMADVSAPDVRDHRYSYAASKALEENDPEKAQSIAARIKERKAYAYLLERIDAALPLAKARRGDLMEVRKILATLGTDQERIATLTELASALAAKGEKEAAKTILDESRQMLSAFLKNYSDLESVVKVANVYAVAAPEQAFSIVEGGIGQMNEYIHAGIKMDEFYNGGAVESDELHLTTINRQLLTHVPNSPILMRSLAIADFERTVNLADNFQRTEIRLFVRLRIAEAVLDRSAAETEKLRRDQLVGDDDEMN